MIGHKVISPEVTTIAIGGYVKAIDYCIALETSSGLERCLRSGLCFASCWFCTKCLCGVKKRMLQDFLHSTRRSVFSPQRACKILDRCKD